MIIETLSWFYWVSDEVNKVKSILWMEGRVSQSASERESNVAMKKWFTGYITEQFIVSLQNFTH